MPNIYELLATEKQCKRYLMRKEQDGTCYYCVEGLIAKTLNLPEYEWEPGKYSFGDPATESVALHNISSSRIKEAGFPTTINSQLLETLLDLPQSIKNQIVRRKRYSVDTFTLAELNDFGITFQQFALIFKALGVPCGNSTMDG